MAGILAGVARAITWIFYRVECSGQVPAAGPVLILPNHPNALLDPAVIWAMAGRSRGDVRFLAKSTLFEGALAPVLRMVRAIPVYRRLDQGVDSSKNSETFAAVARALEDGDAICIFPEGVSHSTGRLVPLRTGAARMALDAERRGVAVQLVAAGLNFDRKTAFRSRATVLFGPAFTVGDLAGAADEAAAVRLATGRIADQMRRLLVEADPHEDAALVDRVERLYSAARGRPGTAQDRIVRRQAIARGMEALRARDPRQFERAASRLRRYDQRLRRFGLRDRHLDWDVSWRAAAMFAVREGLAALCLAPVALCGFVVFWIPYQLTGVVARLANRERDVAATATVLVGAGVYLSWLLLIGSVCWRLWGAAAGLGIAAALPLLAIGGLFAVERELAAAATVRSWWMLRRARHETRARLRGSRSELAALLDDIYGWLSEETPAPAAARRPN
jgi:glycerol-3-phosphate O-acyltransferase / dihydroxyacetone phosphate acyltransferase